MYRIKAPPSFLLNDKLTGLKDPKIANYIDQPTKNQLI